MTPSLPRYVLDSSAIIDLHNGELLKELFLLPYEFVVTDLVLEELKSPHGELLLSKYGLKVYTLPGEQVEKILSFLPHFRRCSAPDISALLLARHQHITILTGDGNLRDAALELDVHIHGTLWVLEEMVSRSHISTSRAISALKKIRECGGRLPESECKRILDRWEKGQIDHDATV